jgi:hypothetical protein
MFSWNPRWHTGLLHFRNTAPWNSYLQSWLRTTDLPDEKDMKPIGSLVGTPADYVSANSPTQDLGPHTHKGNRILRKQLHGFPSMFLPSTMLTHNIQVRKMLMWLHQTPSVGLSYIVLMKKLLVSLNAPPLLSLSDLICTGVHYPEKT